VQSLATLPEFIWELFLGIYCTIRGFRKDAPILADGAERDEVLDATPALSPA
jgi:hypothetical protein